MTEPTYINKRLEELQEEWKTMSLEDRMKHLPQVILLHPAIWYSPQVRAEASAKATEMRRGLLMEIHSSHTEFFAVESIPVGQVEVHAPKTYKGMLEYVTTLPTPETSFGRKELDDWINARD